MNIGAYCRQIKEILNIIMQRILSIITLALPQWVVTTFFHKYTYPIVRYGTYSTDLIQRHTCK